MKTPSKSWMLKVFLLILISGAAIIYLLVLQPRNYDVTAFNPRQGTQYWELPTGSGIGYTLIPAKGDKKPYPVIFLQGGPGSPISDENIRLFSLLADHGYNVYLYDQVGCGHSDRLKKIGEYTAMRHKRDLEEIFKKIGAPKVILVGQSWGAILATLFIADNPGKVIKAIFSGPGPIIPFNSKLASIQPPDSLQLKKPFYSNSDANRNINNPRSRFVAFGAAKFGVKLASDKEMDGFQTYLDQELSRSTVCDTSVHRTAVPGGGFYAQLMTVKSFRVTEDPRPKLKNCKVPVLIMKGQCDNQPWGFTKEYFDLFSNHRFAYFPDAGHSISAEQPERFLKEILDFIQ